MLNENFYLEDAKKFYDNDFAFQQDGAKSHTSRFTMNILSKICDVIVN